MSCYSLLFFIKLSNVDSFYISFFSDVICAQQAFDQQACRCLKCAPEVRNEVTTPHPITKFAISTFVFQNFDDVLEHCNMLAVQHNLPKVIKGNKQKNTKRVKCSRCNENFMTFKNGRLLSCKSLEEFLTPAHYCIGDSHSKLNVTGGRFTNVLTFFSIRRGQCRS